MAFLVLAQLLLLPTPTVGRSGDLTPLLVAGDKRAESYMNKDPKEETLFVERSQLKRAHRCWVKCRSS